MLVNMMQDPTLVRGSLRDNLDPTRRHTDEELWQALEQAHLGDFVSKHSEKLLLETGAGGSNLRFGPNSLSKYVIRESNFQHWEFRINLSGSLLHV